MYDLVQVEQARRQLCRESLAFCREYEQALPHQVLPILIEGLAAEEDGKACRAAGKILIDRVAQLENFDMPELPPPLTLRQRFSRQMHTRSSLQQEQSPGWSKLIQSAGRLRVFALWARPVSEEELESIAGSAGIIEEKVN